MKMATSAKDQVGIWKPAMLQQVLDGTFNVGSEG